MSSHGQIENVDIFRLEELVNSQAIIIVDFWAPGVALVCHLQKFLQKLPAKSRMFSLLK